VAVLHNDPIWGGCDDIAQFPQALIDRLRHYFETYKLLPGEQPDEAVVFDVYDRDRAFEVIRVSMADYEDAYGSD
jgi:inorganic pyrophosphatase